MPFPETCPFPANINPLSPNGFLLSIKKLPEVSYFAQTADLPDISLGMAEYSNPLLRFAEAGEQLEWGMFQLQFLVDEEMKNYQAIYDWMIGLGYPESNEQYQALLTRNKDYTETAKAHSDGVLQVLGSNNVAVKSFIFIDMFPTNLSTLQFTTISTDVTYLVGNVTFKYSHFTMI